MNREKFTVYLRKLFDKSTWWQFAKSELADSESDEIIDSIVDNLSRYAFGLDFDPVIRFDKTLYMVGNTFRVNDFLESQFDEILHHSISRLCHNPDNNSLSFECMACFLLQARLCEETDKYFDLKLLKLLSVDRLNELLCSLR